MSTTPTFPKPAHQKVEELVAWVTSGQLVLPDFQRDFVWEVDRTRKLLESTMAGYPIGSLLTLAVDANKMPIKSRPIEGAPTLPGANRLILDGQQRVTSFFRTLKGIGDSLTFVRLACFFDSSGKAILDPESVPWDDLIVVEPVARRKKDPVQDILDEQWHRDAGLFPLKDMMVGSKVDDFIDDVHQSLGIDKTEMRLARDRYLRTLLTYEVPTIKLPQETSIAAICSIFENINQYVVPLGPFEILTARFFNENVNLRDLWDEALQDHPILGDFDDLDGYAMLQAVCLRASKSAQKSDVLKLHATDINAHWKSVASGMAEALQMFRAESGVKSKAWLPYKMLAVVLAAVWQQVDSAKGATRGAIRDKLKQYFWCTVFTGNFDQGANSQAGADYVALTSWVAGSASGAPPEAVAKFSVLDQDLLAATVRRRALYRGVMALTLRRGAQDFHSGRVITEAELEQKLVDSHHVFPKNYLKTTTSQADPDLIMNRALIDKKTNQTILDRAPSAYLAPIQQARGSEFPALLDSHLLPSDPASGLANDDYDVFVQERLELVIAEIEAVTGQKVSRLSNTSSP